VLRSDDYSLVSEARWHTIALGSSSAEDKDAVFELYFGIKLSSCWLLKGLYCNCQWYFSSDCDCRVGCCNVDRIRESN
jgi:hypothetical protein